MIDVVVLNMIACLENSDVVNEVRKSYELRVQKLANYQKYIKCDEFAKKEITDMNFQNCVKFVIDRLSQEDFLTFAEKGDVFRVVFYKKEPLKGSSNKKPVIKNGVFEFVVDYTVVGDELLLYTHPLPMYKQRLLENEADVLEKYRDVGVIASKLRVCFYENDTVIDDIGESLLKNGFVMSKKNPKK